MGRLVQPPDFRPAFVLPPTAAPEVAYVWKTEEKGSDVNLGVHLVRDAFKGHFDLAAVLSNDTDLVEPVRIVTQELNLPVTLLTPDRTGRGLADEGGDPCAACRSLYRAVPAPGSDTRAWQTANYKTGRLVRLSQGNHG
jgi:hypothetical protein